VNGMGLSRPRNPPVRARHRRRPDDLRSASSAGAVAGSGDPTEASLRSSCPSTRPPPSALASPVDCRHMKDLALGKVILGMPAEPADSAPAGVLAAAVLLAHRRSEPAIGGMWGAALSSPQAGCGEVSATVDAPLLCLGMATGVGIRPRINHMKLDKHTRRLFLSPSVRITRSRLFFYFSFSLNLRCYNFRYTPLYIKELTRY
jgi:hypothetical protein